MFIADTANNVIRKVDTNGIITTVAGNGTNGYSGDGGAATSAKFNWPNYMVFDQAGNLYIADNPNAVVRKLDTNGIITTVAGNGTNGYSGDGGAATSAQLNFPRALCFDSNGNLYIADRGNNAIRKVAFSLSSKGISFGTASQGNVSTLTLSNVAASAAGNYTVVVSDALGSCVTSSVAVLAVTVNKATPVVAGVSATGITYGQSLASSSLSGTATNAAGVAVAGSFAFVNSSLTPNAGVTNVSYVFTPTDAADYSSVTGTVTVTVGKGTPVVASVSASRIGYGMSLASSTLSGTATNAGGLAVAGSFAFVNSSLMPNAGVTNVNYVFTPVDVVDYNSVTGMVTVTVGLIITSQPTDQTVVAGGPTAFSVQVSGTAPYTYQWRFNGTNVSSTNAAGLITTVAGNGTWGYSGDGGAATNAALSYFPRGLAVDSSGNLYIADTGNSVIRKVAANGIITTVAGTGSNGYSGDDGAATEAELFCPEGVTFDSSGNMFIADYYNSMVRKVDTKGIITTVAGILTLGYSGDGGAATNAALCFPTSVKFDSSGNLFIADSGNGVVRKVNTKGIITTVAENSSNSGAATNLSFSFPADLAFDSTGNLFIADDQGSVIWKVDTNGIKTVVAGTGRPGYTGDGGLAINATFSLPESVAFDSSGNLFIADIQSNVVRKVDTKGIITTVVGNGTRGYSGDGGPATNAILYGPKGLCFDSNDNLYIADAKNLVIRKVTFGLPSSLVSFGISNQGNTSTLTLSNVAASAAGNYTVVVSDALGSCVTSSVAMLTVTVTVNKATPVVAGVSATGITYGQSLASSTLSGTVTNAAGVAVAGSFAFVNSSLTPNVGVANVSYVFTPTDTAHYNSVTGSVAVMVGKATPVVVMVYATPIYCWQSLTNSTLKGMAENAAGAVVAGSFAFVNSSLPQDPSPGVVSMSYVFTPTDTAHYNSVTGTVNLTLNKRLAQIYLAPPFSDGLEINSLGFAVEYNGSEMPVIARTDPAGLEVDIKYNGSSQAPTDVGNYLVTAEVVDNTYSGTSGLRMMIYASGSSNVVIYPPNVTNNVVQLPILGVPYTTEEIKASDDFVSWRTIGWITIPASGYTTFTDVVPANNLGRYYRLVP